MDHTTLVRALHVLAVAHWIGGVAFVTLVVLPLALRRNDPEIFEAVELRFSGQARVSVLVAGASGLWLTWRLDLWSRFSESSFWWMSGMALLWAVFAMMLFVVEPLLQGRITAIMRLAPRRTLRLMLALHVILLIAATAVVAGAVAGAH